MSKLAKNIIKSLHIINLDYKINSSLVSVEIINKEKGFEIISALFYLLFRQVLMLLEHEQFR